MTTTWCRPEIPIAPLPLARPTLSYCLNRWSLRAKGNAMAWTTPILIEICVGLEINGYLPAEF